ncbi:MAG: DUF87 domain-containing protein [Candidatus Bathyarchaeota archaeon]|nr:DUF87 domain-containing protein [Candidatus Bathyarchaeota archaeon]
MDHTSVRVREHFGLISNDSHIEQFTFLVSPPKSRVGVQKGDYVIVDHPLLGDQTQILAVIKDISSYEEIAGSTINERKGKMLAIAHVLGCIDLSAEAKPLRRVLVPPTPGSRVYIPLKGFLQDILNRNQKGQPFKAPIEIGTYEGAALEEASSGPVKAFIDAEDFTGQHSLISADAGAGKTVTAKKLIRATQAAAATRIVIFDPYGEYGDVVQVNLDVGAVEGLQKELGKPRVVGVSAVKLSLTEKQAAYSEALVRLLKLRLEDKIGPTLVVVEEAENLVGFELAEALSKGRKVGLALCMITSSPSALGSEILSQVATQLAGKTSQNVDLEVLPEAAAGLSAGEWVLSGVNLSRALKVNVA